MGKKFDVVIGNPPYEKPQIHKGKRGGGTSLWDKFVECCLVDRKKTEGRGKNKKIYVYEKWCKDNGYICMIHPALWRKPEHKLWNIMSNKQIEYLELHNSKDGLKVFKAGTRYDWYVMKNCKVANPTVIKDDEGIKYNIRLDELPFLPNSGFKEIFKLLAKDNEEKINILYNRSACGNDKSWTSFTKTSRFKHVCIHATNKSGIRYLYSSKRNLKAFFGISKVIFGDSGVNGNSIIDIDGKYGLTDHSFGLKVDTKKEAQQIKKTLDSDKFATFLKKCTWSNFGIEWRVFKYFRKDFWKDFV